MRIGIHVGHWEGEPRDLVAPAVEAERAGLDSVWTSETWGSDAVVALAWIAARTERIAVGTGVLQMPARTPASVAMAAITLDHLSGGRLRLGLGTSGPQVVEGWHGVPFEHPLQRTREYVDIVRAILRRDAPVTYEGREFRLPVDPAGPGKALKANVRPLRAAVPVYVAAMGPRNVSLGAEIAEGWLPFLYSPERSHVFAEALRSGLARRNRDDGTAFDITPLVPVAIGRDVAACRDAVRPTIALYVGGMGSRGRNFYHALVSRYGYEAEADAIQDAFLEGRRGDAVASVPDQLVDELALVGSVDQVRDRLAAWRSSGATTLLGQVRDPQTVRLIAEAAE